MHPGKFETNAADYALISTSLGCSVMPLPYMPLRLLMTTVRSSHAPDLLCAQQESSDLQTQSGDLVTRG
jgi:hypothetical protein